MCKLPYAPLQRLASRLVKPGCRGALHLRQEQGGGTDAAHGVDRELFGFTHAMQRRQRRFRASREALRKAAKLRQLFGDRVQMLAQWPELAAWMRRDGVQPR